MRRDYFLLTGLAFLFFVPCLGLVHLFDWDEINFAECAREMLLTGDWMRPQIDYEPFWEKPPLFLWMQAASMSLFGVNEFAARLPNALCGWATLMLVYHLGLRLHDRMFGWLWALAWLGSLLPHLYFRSGIIDPWFNFFIFCGLYGFIEFRWQFFATGTQPRSWWVRYRHLLLGGGVLGLAVLTKGPTAYLIVLLVLLLYWARYRFRGRGYLRHVLLFSGAAAAAALLWFGAELMLHGTWFVQEFLAYQVRLFATPDSGHGGFWGYHAVVLLLGCFPVSVFALPNLWGDRTTEEELMEADTLASCKRSDFATWMQLLFWVVLVLFSVVRTKIVHYSSLAYFPITYLGVATLWRAIRWQVYPKVVGVLLPVLGILLGGAAAALPWLGQRAHLLKPLFSQDAFGAANLEAEVQWSVFDMLPGLILMAASVLATVYWVRRQAGVTGQVAFAGGAVFTATTLLSIVPNIERYTQGAAIEFYQKQCGVDCYVRPVGFKSYAHLFYTCKPPVGADKMVDDYENLAHGSPYKKVYFVAKINRLEELPSLSHCRELYRKNGFVFFERTVPQ